MKASEHIDKFKSWGEDSHFPEISRYFIQFEDSSKYLDEYKKLEKSIGLRLPESFFDLLEEKGRLILNIDFLEPLDVFQDFEDALQKNVYWHIGAPSFNGLVIMTPEEMINAYEQIQFALGKKHHRGKYWYPIATTRSDMEEGWLFDMFFEEKNKTSLVAPYYMDCIFRYDDTLELEEKLTMSIENFDNFIGDYLIRLQRQLLKLNEKDIRILIDKQINYLAKQNLLVL
jgi:hypothetical protein